MLPVKLLTFMLISLTSVKCVYSEPVGKKVKAFVNAEGCGVRPGKQSTSSSSSIETGQEFALEDNLEEDDEMMYDDTGMESRVVGGTASTTRWPWMAGIFDQGFHACGGPIIDNRHVLTAAHCFDESINPRDYVVRVGELSQGDSGKSYQVEWIKIHEGYSKAPTYFNDIALLRLREPIPDGAAVPICLPIDESLGERDNLTIIGFGAKEEGGQESHTLQEIHNVPVMPTPKCNQIIKSLSPALKGVGSAQICTGDEKGGKSSCQGDSGGPVVFEEGGRWWLLGLVSYSAGCARPGIPTVHTRVSAHRQWIDRNIAEGGNKKRPKTRVRTVFNGIFNLF